MSEAPFAIYCRASEEGPNGHSSDLAEQEAAAREWAQRAGVEVAEVVEEVASGGLMAQDRKLGGLIERIESGELAGVIVRDEKRFARDTMAAGSALLRITDAGGRLVTTWTGFDTANLTPESKLTFNVLIAVGQAEKERNLLRRVRGKARAAARGVYCARVPFGYVRDDDGRLRPHSEDAEAVRQVFRARARGVGFSELARLASVQGRMSRYALRHMVANRAYLGEQRIPTEGRKGEPTVLRDSHPPIVTEAEWEAANAVRGRPPLRSGLSKTSILKGIARCAECGRALHVTGYGTKRDENGMRAKRTYACPAGHTSLKATALEPAVMWALDRAIADREPHVAAVIEGDTRYADAMEAVKRAQRALEEYRDDVDLQLELGTGSFAEGLRRRKAGLAAARKALRDVPRPDKPAMPVSEMTLEEAGEEDRRAFYRRAIAEVRVWPTRLRPKGERVELRWAGSEEWLRVPEWKPVELVGLGLDVAGGSPDYEVREDGRVRP